jgi:hypothetical protein
MTIVTLQAVDLTPYGKPAFGRLPTGLGKPAAGFPQLHSLDDDDVHNLSNSGLTPYRGTESRRRPRMNLAENPFSSTPGWGSPGADSAPPLPPADG